MLPIEPANMALRDRFKGRSPCRLVCATLTVGVLAGCSERAVEPQRTVFGDSGGVRISYTRIDSTAPACSLSENVVRIGAVAGESAYELFDVRDAVRLDDSSIAILNVGTSQVKIFDSGGAFVREFGRRGPGPGEFRNLWSLDTRGDNTLVVGEYRPWRFSFFTSGGDFIRSVEAKPPIIERPEVGIVLSSGGSFLIGERCCTIEQDGFWDETVMINRYGSAGSIADSIGRFWLATTGFLSRELRYLGGPIFGARAAFAYFPGDTLVYASGRFEQVELWTRDGKLGRLVRWNARDRQVRREDVEEWKRQFRETFRGDPSSPHARTLLQAQIGEQRPIAGVFPAREEWGGLLVSRDGTIWVKEFRRPFDRGADRWLVFYPSGEFACQVMIPDRIDLLHVGTDYVLGRERDSFDVEYVVERRFRLPMARSDS
jgi:hypothetical protein